MASILASSNQDYWFIFQNDQLLFINNGTEEKLISGSFANQAEPFFIRHFPLGQLNDKNIYCAELSPDFSLLENMIFISLRQALEVLDAEWYGMAAKAFSIISWDKNHYYCGRCGTITKKLPHLFERQCPACDLSFYPRISPSIIVRIQKGDHILLARGHHFKPGVYALIAGFVEPGETLEQAVHREVMEEVGIKIKNLRYFGSQAWPFPDSLMISFTADYASGELSINYDEIKEAGWYRYDHLPGHYSSSVSIAKKLIDHFVLEKNS